MKGKEIQVLTARINNLEILLVKLCTLADHNNNPQFARTVKTLVSEWYDHTDDMGALSEREYVTSIVTKHGSVEEH